MTTSSVFHFKLRKAIQATAFLLRQAGPSHSKSYLRIIKLLYIADRESLRTRGRPITGDFVVAMKHGPVVSRIYDLVRGHDPESDEWDAFIERSDYKIRLAQDPGSDELSTAEIDILQRVWNQHLAMGDWDIVEETHEFPEWQKNDPGASSKPIPLEDILEAVGRHDANAIITDACQVSAVKAILEKR